MATDRRQYLNDYQKNYIQVKVVFDKRKQEHREMLEWIRSQGDASTYIKKLVEQDMKKAVE